MIRRRQQRGSVGTCRYHGAPMTPLTHDRYCDEVITQTGLLRDILQGADLSLTVPTCPDWTLARLVRHIGGNLRSVETAVRTGRAVEDPGRQVPDAAGSDGDDPATLDAWLADAAQTFAGTLRNAGPGAEAKVWAFQRSTAFWARRAANDLVIHRADAAGTVHADYTVAPELAGPGRSIHLHATDTEAGLGAEWFIELGTDGFTWRRGHEKATVALRGPLADVLRVFHRRLPADSERVEVVGDAALLDFWLERVSLR